MFTESNTIESLVRDALCGGITHHTAAGPGLALKAGKLAGAGWVYLAPQHLPRREDEVWVEPFLREALVRLNPEIAARPDRADEVLYRLRAAVTSARADGLVKANEVFVSWLRGDRTMPFGPKGEHVPVRLLDLEAVANNQWVLTSQYTFRVGAVERRMDLVLLVNGLPLGVIEAKTPTRPAVGWVDGVLQLLEYQDALPELFVPNVLTVLTNFMPIGIRLAYNRYGNFPITNFGSFGVKNGTPILSSPMIAVLCCGMIQSEPVTSKDGGLASKEILPVTLVFDHRPIDGAYGGRFLSRLKNVMESEIDTVFK